MAGLVPFNRNKNSMKPTGFEGFYNMLDDFFNDAWTLKSGLTNGTFRVDIQENEKEYYVEAELPGVKKDQIMLQLNEGRLSISIKNEDVVKEESKNYIHRERRFSAMERSIYLADAKPEGIQAKLDNGILCITVPKQEQKKNTLQIDIQ